MKQDGYKYIVGWQNIAFLENDIAPLVIFDIMEEAEHYADVLDHVVSEIKEKKKNKKELLRKIEEKLSSSYTGLFKGEGYSIIRVVQANPITADELLKMVEGE